MVDTPWRTRLRGFGAIFSIIFAFFCILSLGSGIPELIPSLIAYAFFAALLIYPWVLFVRALGQQLDRWWAKLLAAIFLLFPLGIALVRLLFGVYDVMDRLSWTELEAAPAPLVRFEGPTLIRSLSDEVFASDAQGQLYGYECEDEACIWLALDELPPPPDPAQAPMCAHADDESHGLWRPLTWGRVMDRSMTVDCWAEYSRTTYFVLMSDGRVWSRVDAETAYSIIGMLVVVQTMGACLALIGFFLMLPLPLSKPPYPS